MKFSKLLPYLLIILVLTLLFMRQQFAFFTFLLLLLILVDVYVFMGFKNAIGDTPSKTIWTVIYWAVSLFTVGGFYYGLTKFDSHQIGVRNGLDNFIIGLAFSIFITKIVLFALFAVYDVSRVLVGAGLSLKNLIAGGEDGQIIDIPGRRKFVSTALIGLSAVPFLGMLYGITKGKYHYSVNKLSLAFKDLPKAFHGLRIAQISDVHSGSFDSVEEVRKGLQMIMEQKPDMIVFTGDLVNEFKDEINPFMDAFAELEAPLGKFAILGNHDYYGAPRDNELAKQEYWADFFKKYRTMGFDLLRNEHRAIQKDGQAFTLAGVENWGAGRFFPKKGDLDKALVGTNPDDFCLLLSHDPTHWEHHVLNHNKHVNLTLSGHTHGMQFGINIPGFKWSPVQYRYKRWMGLYEELGQYLYVNRGFGFLGYPGRVGMWPEITILDLESISA